MSRKSKAERLAGLREPGAAHARAKAEAKAPTMGFDAALRAQIDAVALAVGADGVITEGEIAETTSFLTSLLAEPIRRYLEATVDRIKAGQTDELLRDLCRAVPSEQGRRALFARAASVLVSDGQMADAEARYLVKLRQALCFSELDALQILAAQIQVQNLGTELVGALTEALTDAFAVPAAGEPIDDEPGVPGLGWIEFDDEGLTAAVAGTQVPLLVLFRGENDALQAAVEQGLAGRSGLHVGSIDLAPHHGLGAASTLVLYRGGKRLGALSGVTDGASVVAFLDEHLLGGSVF